MEREEKEREQAEEKKIFKKLSCTTVEKRENRNNQQIAEHMNGRVAHKKCRKKNGK